MRSPSILAATVVLAASVVGWRAAPQQPPHEKQGQTAKPCQPDRTVDEYLAEINKRKGRNANPLPDNICIFGWCAGGRGEPIAVPFPTNHPPVEQPPKASGESSSEDVPYDPIAAARTVEVGDFYFKDKSYRAALSRYREGLALKPGDALIYLRLGRTFEKLKELEKAYEFYDGVVALAPTIKEADEARKALDRLRTEVEKRGMDVGAVHMRNMELKPACVVSPEAANN